MQYNYMRLSIARRTARPMLTPRSSSLLSLFLAERANFIAVVVIVVLPLLFWFLLLLLIAVLLQMLLLLLHVMLVVFMFLFNFLHHADASSTDMDPLASGRSPHTLAGTVHCW